MRAERNDAGSAAGRGYPSPRAGGSSARGRAPERPERERPERGHPARGGRPPERRGPDPRSARSGPPRPSAEVPRLAADDRRIGSAASGRTRTAPVPDSRLRGVLAVLGVFLLTLVAAAADSYIGLGLGMITLVALTAGTAVATLIVRRRDLLTVVIAPPLVFIAVAVVNLALAPSADLTLPGLATLLVRGFPAMGIATGAAVALSLFRMATKR
ncbi:conserved membrane protein of unknown function [Modestobacter italicus]|uniref:DUF6542 domain-containing protein n=1 Tax=Modestobacter italicus (strain DSM 44449 / CECT 9708 / BC 501) TaxID=2732864 RepID=I4ET00_MODI5|nr:DUF6542 domain-containing protein [Modestobacter marinus]CCH86513.1 conserved membrane protein of unknown function [Modestobacter marinus]